MTWIDWVIAAVLLLYALQGLQRGFVVALLGALGVIVSYLVASVWYSRLAEAFVRQLFLPRDWAATSAFALLLFVSYAIIGLAILVLFDTERLSVSSKALGVVGGVVKGTLLSMALLTLALASPLGDTVQQDVKHSTLAPYAADAQKAFVQLLATVLPIHPFGAKETRF